MKRTFITSGALLMTCLLIGSALLLPLGAQTPALDDAAEAALTPRLKQMLNVMRIARSRHLLKPENPEMIDGAIRGLLARLDPDAELYTPKDVERLGLSTSKAMSFGSGTPKALGIVVRKLAMPPRSTGPAYQIVSTIDNSPAARAGLHAGDLVASVNGVPTSELLSFDFDLSKQYRNQGMVELTVLRGPSNGPFDLLLSQVDWRFGPAVSTRLPMGLLLFRGWEVSNPPSHAESAQRAHETEFSGIILDLRDVSSGDVEQAIRQADLFLDAGIITTFETRNAAAVPYTAKPGDRINGKPIVVLINAGTAGAAEILAAALQDNKRATLIGSKSAGLGAVSSFVPLPGNRGAIRMKTGRYLSPSGRSLDKGGIKPDIEIKPAVTDAAQACREVDKPADDGDGQCERRSVADDPVLQAAIAYLDGTATATKP